MDTDALFEHARARFDHAAARRLLKDKYEARMLFGYNGGMFRATPEMICFLSLYGDQEIVVADLYQNPIRINADEMCTMMKARWQEQMNAWLAEFEATNQKR